jgi:hypothetical protein
MWLFRLQVGLAFPPQEFGGAAPEMCRLMQVGNGSRAQLMIVTDSDYTTFV